MSELENILISERVRFSEGIFFDESPDNIDTAFDDESHNNLFEVEDDSFWFKSRNRVIEAGINGSPPRGKILADIGGGNGMVSKHFQDLGWEVILFEPGLSGARNAVRRGVKNVVCGLFGRAIINPGSVDAVGIFDVLEHIENEREFLTEIRNCMAQDSMLYITVPAYKALWSGSDEKGHFRRYNMRTLSKIVQESGFEVVRMTFFFRYLVIPIFLLRALPHKLFKRESAVRPSKAKDKNRSQLTTNSAIEHIVDLLVNKEIRSIESGNNLRWGASLFCIATKS